MLFRHNTKLSFLLSVEYSVDHLQKEVILNQSRRRNQVSIRITAHLFESYLQKSSAEEAIMIHEKIVFKNKQSVESKSSNRSMKEIRRESLLSMNDIEDEFDATSISYHIQNLDQLKYWLKKNEISIVTTWTNMRNEHAAFFNQLNKKIDEMNELTKNYNTQTNKLHDVMLIIRELRIEQREKNIEAINSNIFLFIIEDEVVVFIVTFKKLFDSSVFIDDKDSIIDDWLSVMRNKLEENANWFFTDVQQKTYVRIRIDDEVMKHLIFRFFKNSIKSYIIAKKIFDDLYQIFDDSNRRINALKTYRRFKQIESFKNFNTFWIEFQRLESDSELYNQEALLEYFKNKMSYELQKVFAIESYKAIDLHEFVKMYRYTNQTFRNVNNKFKNIRENFEDNADDAARDEEIIVIVNSNQNNNRSISRSRFEIFESEFVGSSLLRGWYGFQSTNSEHALNTIVVSWKWYDSLKLVRDERSTIRSDSGFKDSRIQWRDQHVIALHAFINE